jgi:transposase InsO family protein
MARDLRKWLAATGAKTVYIEPDSPGENGNRESFNPTLRDEFLNGWVFYSMKDIRVLAEPWRFHYKTVSPRSSLDYRPSPPEAWRTQRSQGYQKVKSRESFPLFHTPTAAG